MLNGACLRYCKILNHPAEKLNPTKMDKTVMMSNFNLKGNLFFSMNFVDIQRLIVANKKKIIAAAKNRLILETKLIKKIFENPNASNHK
jgi:hypothetical protein